MTDDLLKRADLFLRQCPICSLVEPCNCRLDYRPVLLDLVREVERLRGQLDEIRHLHTDSPAGVCPSCFRNGDMSDTDDGLVAWPCPTLRAMGVEAVRFG